MLISDAFLQRNPTPTPFKLVLGLNIAQTRNVSKKADFFFLFVELFFEKNYANKKKKKKEYFSWTSFVGKGTGNSESFADFPHPLLLVFEIFLLLNHQLQIKYTF